MTVIGQRIGLSQSAFAARIGVPEGTLVNWEQGRRQPSRPAKLLLALLAKKPNLVMELSCGSAEVIWAPGLPYPNIMTAYERLVEVGEILSDGIKSIYSTNSPAQHSKRDRQYSENLAEPSVASAPDGAGRTSARRARLQG